MSSSDIFYTFNEAKKSITIFDIEYVATLDKKTGKYRRYHSSIYPGHSNGTDKVDIYFNSINEFAYKIYERIPDEIKEQYGYLPTRVEFLENSVQTLSNRVNNIEVKTNNRFDVVETHNSLQDSVINKHEIDITSLQSENEKLTLLVQQLQENDRIQSDKLSEHKSRIVTLESDVSILKTENIDLRKDVSLLQRTVSKHETTISDNVHEIKYINSNQDKLIDKAKTELTEIWKDDLKHSNKYFETLYKQDNELLHSIADNLDISRLGEIVYENMLPTKDDIERFDRLNKLMIQYNERLDTQEKSSDTNRQNIVILDKRTLIQREKINKMEEDVLKTRTRVDNNRSNINILDKRTLRQGDEIQENSEELLYTYQERKARERERLKQVAETMRQRKN